jgi:serine/threonine protein kinase
MNPLPQLRTVHSRPAASETVSAQSPDAPTQSGGPPRRAPDAPAVDLSRLPAPARGLLLHLHAHRLLADADLVRFLEQVGDRARALTTRERAADALVHFGHISKYVRGRALAGHLGGLLFGPYRVLDRAGAGTVGVVFVGEHSLLKRPVAIKVLAGPLVEDANARGRFVGEAAALAAVSHPHVVGVFDAGMTHDGGEAFWYLVQEWAGGGDLEQAVYDRGAAGLEGGCRWGWQAAAGLDAAHRAGLVHRDVKPSNLLLDAADRIKVGDFGLVRHHADLRTPVDAVVGSFQFMAPEQLNDPTTAGPPADVYGLGATLYWAMSGKLPRPDGRPSEVVQHLRTRPAERLKAVRPDTPAELDDLFARMLARNPADRPKLPEAMAVFARFAAPTGVPEVTARVLPEAGANETDTLRAAVGQLEQELAQARKQRDEAQRAVLKALHAATGMRPGGYERGQRVAAYAVAIARHLGEHPNWSGYRSPAARGELAAIAAACGVGLLGAADEREQPALAAGVLDRLAEEPAPLPFLRAARDAVLHHHERWDGTGWPNQLSGTAIPPVARLIAVAVAFDQLTSAPLVSGDAAVVELMKQAGAAFDPDVIAAARAAADELKDLLPAVEVELLPDAG